MNFHLLADCPAPQSFAPDLFAARSLKRATVLALILVLAVFAQRALLAQNYPGYAPQYQQQPYPPQQYAQQPQYAPQPQNAAQPQYNQQPYADPGYAGSGAGDPQPGYGSGNGSGYARPQQPAQQPFAAQQLEQLVAPIALYPDALVAQILAASTYPAQVIAADNWLHSQGYATPDQIAYGADAQTNWDPSVKGLTAFPQVLDLMNRDLHWTTDLGNAYYNQPQDVLQTIQVMRQRAEAAGTLQSTPQEQVSNNQGYIQLAPSNPQVVYVPAYNPWDVYGQPVSPYPGFSLIGALQSFAGSGAVRYGLGIAMAAFSHTPYGWAGWALNWLASNILFHQSPYQSQSTSVAHWGNPHGGNYGGQGGGGINRFPRPEQAYNRPGNSYAQGNGFSHGNDYARVNGYVQPAFSRPPVRTPENYGYNRAAVEPSRAYSSNYVRPAQQSYTQPQPARAQAYARPGNSFYSSSQPAYAGRPATPYAGQQTYRAPASNYQRNELAQHSYAEPRSYGGSRNFAESAPKQSGGFHMFGGGHSEEHYKAPKAMKAPKAPKMSGGGGHHGGGGFSHHGGR
jgi:hypothetical protein